MIKVNLFDNSPSHIDDKELVSNIYKWNHQLYIELYERYKWKIYNYIMNILWHNENDATIVITDIFTKLWELVKWGNCNDIDNINAYIYRLSHNMSINHIKWKWSWNFGNIDDREWELTTWEDPSDYTEIEYTKDQVKKALELLDPTSRSVVYMIYFEEKDYESIAQIIWSNKNTIWTILFRAKKKLKEIMQR